jgi:hypothetical protein
MVLERLDLIYILINPRREKSRMDRLLPHLLERGIPPEKIAISGPTWGDELTTQQIFQFYDPFCRAGVPVLTFKARCLSRGEISLVLNFISGIADAVTKKYKTVLFLESDVFLRSDFVERLETILTKLEQEPDWDYVSLGEGARTRPPGHDTSFFGETKLYDPPHEFVFRCTDSMLFHGKFLQKIIHTIVPFRECLDWELNLQHMFHRSKALWADPPLVEQGTSCGRIVTHLTS